MRLGKFWALCERYFWLPWVLGFDNWLKDDLVVSPYWIGSHYTTVVKGIKYIKFHDLAALNLDTRPVYKEMVRDGEVPRRTTGQVFIRIFWHVKPAEDQEVRWMDGGQHVPFINAEYINFGDNSMRTIREVMSETKLKHPDMVVDGVVIEQQVERERVRQADPSDEDAWKMEMVTDMLDPESGIEETYDIYLAPERQNKKSCWEEVHR